MAGEFEQFDPIRLRALMQAQDELTRKKYYALNHISDIADEIMRLKAEMEKFQNFVDGKTDVLPKKEFEAPDPYPNG